MEYYTPNKILSMNDLDGLKPEVRMIVGNKQAGKTFSVKRLAVRTYLKRGEKFCVLVRRKNNVPGRAETFWEDVGPLKFPGFTLTQKSMLGGLCANLFLNDKHCGYVASFDDSENVKNNSTRFADINNIFFDEFMPENQTAYLTNEFQKFDTFRHAVGRGGAAGGHARRLNIYMCSNNVTMFNPYFEQWDIPSRYQPGRTRFLRGHGWVVEFCHNQEAADALRENNRSSSDDTMKYATGLDFMLDNRKFVRKIPGEKYPILRFRYNGRLYGVWGSMNTDYFYIANKIKCQATTTLVVDTREHDEGTRLVTKHDPYILTLRDEYMSGRVFFENGSCKSAFISLITSPSAV